MSVSSEPGIPPPRVVNPQNQQNPETRATPLPSTYQSIMESPRNVAEGSIGERRPSGITGSPLDQGDLPMGGSVNAPTTPGSRYYEVKAPSGQTIYFSSMGEAQAYASTEPNLAISKTNQATGIIGGIEGGAATGFGYLQQGFTGLFNLGAQAGLGARELATGQKIGGNVSNLSLDGITESQAATEAGYLGAYGTPGAGILKGIGERNASVGQRAFDIGVGALSAVPVVGEAAGLTAEGSIGARFLTSLGNPVVRTGLGAGISGGATALAGGSPTQIGESALLGGGLSYGAGALIGRLGSSAAAGRTSQILYEAGQGSGPTINQRIAMLVLNQRSLKAAPVAGIETTESGIAIEGTGVDISNFPGATGNYAQGRLASQSLLQEIEGSAPSGARVTGGLEGQISPPAPPPSVSYMSEHITDIPYSNLFNISEDIRLGQGITQADYTPSGQYRQGEAFFQGEGPSGPGAQGLAGRGLQNLSTEQQYLRYPSSSSTDLTIRFRTTYEENQGLSDFQGFGSGFPSAISLTGLESGALQSQGAQVRIGQTPSQSQEQSLTSQTALTQDESIIPSGTYIQPEPQGTIITPILIPSFETPFSPATPNVSGSPPVIFPFAILLGPSSPLGGPTRNKKRYRFGERLNLIQSVYGGNLPGFERRKK